MSEDESSIHYENTPIQDEKDLLHAMKSLFSFAFTLNCHLDDASITSEEKLTLSTLEAPEIFENLKDLIIDLLKFKQKLKKTDMAELENRSDQFETIIQNLEAKIRTHIGIEQQLKLHIENTQNQCEELEKINSQLKKGGSIHNSDKNSCEKYENEMKNLKEKINELEKENKKKEEDYYRIINENAKLKKMIEDKSRQIYSLKKSFRTRVDCAESNGYIKKQIEEQNSEILKIQQRLKKDVYGWSPRKKSRPKSIKKCTSPVDGSQYISPAFKLAQKYIRGHIRSFSEH